MDKPDESAAAWHQPERRKGKVGGDLQHFALAAPAGLGNTVIHGLQFFLMHLFEQHSASPVSSMPW